MSALDTHDPAVAQPDRPLSFPPGFVWGAATAAYQIEGSVDVDGRLPSIWDEFCRWPGAVAGGDTGDVAADHYRLVADDVRLMADLGLPAYRFSVSWPRVSTTGAGEVNAAGLDFYDRLVDALLANAIEPYVTLYHWDLPLALERRGGWPERETAYRFAEFATAVAARLGDRATHWSTLNERWCAAFLGYSSGVHAPGRTEPAASLAAAHHLLLGHGLAAQSLRAELPATAQLSLTLNQTSVRPATGATADLRAVEKVDGLMTRLFLDPLLRGRYPADVQAFTSHLTDWAFVRDGDLELVSAPIDAIGVNYYSPVVVRGLSPAQQDAGTAEAAAAFPGCDDVGFVQPPGPQTGMGWAIDASGLSDVLTRLAAESTVPLMITENGAAFPDPEPTQDGRLHDPDRVRYLRAHLAAAHAAVERGVDLRGYFVWSLLDNFEWAYGYEQRFGVVHVDYLTQRRVPKDSAFYFREAFRQNAVPPLDAVAER